VDRSLGLFLSVQQHVKERCPWMGRHFSRVGRRW